MTTKVYSLNLEQQQPSGLEDDGALHYGYGCFETLCVSDGRPVLAKAHLERFHHAADFLKIEFPFSDDALLSHAHTLSEGCHHGILKWILTAGNRRPNFRFESPKLLMTLTPKLLAAPTEISVKLIQDPFPRSVWDTHKTLNYAKPIWHKHSLLPHEDLLFTSPEGHLLEATTSTLFLINGNDLLTPDHPYILKGITRQWILDHAQKFGFKAQMKPLIKTDFEEVEAAFLANSMGLSWIHGKSPSTALHSRLEEMMANR